MVKIHKTLHPEFLASIEFNRKSLMTVGLRQFYYENNWDMAYFRENWYLILTMFNMTSCLISEAIYVVITLRNIEDLFAFSALIPCTGFIFLAWIKSVVTWRNRFPLMDLLVRLGQRWSVKDDEETKAIKKKFVDRLNFVCKTDVLMWNLTVIICFNLYPLIERAYIIIVHGSASHVPLRQPYSLYLPFDQTKPFSRYCILFVIMNYCGGIATFAYCAGDCLIFVVAAHICLQNTLLQKDINELDPEDENLYDNVSAIVEKHQFLLKASEDLEEITRNLILYTLMATTMVICFSGFRATVDVTDEFLSFFLGFISSVIQTYMMCFHGELLEETSTGIAVAVYDCQWFRMPLKIQKDLQLIMLRAQKPCLLTAASLRDVNMNCFTKILSTSWSYFTLLRTMYEP